MTRIYPEQIAAQLNDKLFPCYLLMGNDPLLLQESSDYICQHARQLGFDEKIDFLIDHQTDWSPIYSYCQEMALFSNSKLLLLHFPDNGLAANQSDALVELISLLHSELLLIIRSPKLTKSQENSVWYKALKDCSILVNCQTPESAQFIRWVNQRAKQQNLILDEQSVQLLAFFYEGNLLALAQALERLTLIFPAAGRLTLLNVEQVVNDAAHFTPYHLIDATLAGKSKRAWHILRQLQQEGVEILIILRSLQKELLQLWAIKRQMQHTQLKQLLDQHKVWQSRRPIVTQILQRLSLDEFKFAIALLTQIELTLKSDFGETVWPEFDYLIMYLCGKPLPTIAEKALFNELSIC